MWELLYEEFWDKLEHFCYKLCRDDGRAEDLTQEVFLRALQNQDIPDSTKQEAAELAVVHSRAYKAGTGAKVAVDTTEVKNIWKANGAKPGMVLYEVYTTVYVTPREDLAERLKQKK